MRELSSRLSTIQALIPQGVRVADIGTDHAHLPISLIKSGRCPFVIASDIKEKPLKNAEQNIKKTNTENIDLRLGSGLSTVQPEEVDCIVIAGMGGEVISSILADTPWVKDCRYELILQPVTSADFLRKYLCDNGFKILTETAVSENDKLYTVMKVVFFGEYILKSEAYYRIGEMKYDTDESKKYIDKQIAIVKKCISDLKKANHESEILRFKNLLCEMEKCI